jgi:hypothetical protein
MGWSDSRCFPPRPPEGRSLAAPWRWIVSSEMNSGFDSLRSPLSGPPSGCSMSASLPFPSSRSRPPQDGHFFASLLTCHDLRSTPMEPRTLAFLASLSILDCFAPLTPSGQPCGLAISLRSVLHTVTESPSTSQLLRGYINLQVIASHPVAYQFPCIRFVEIVSPFLGIVLILRSSSLVTRCLPRFLMT